MGIGCLVAVSIFGAIGTRVIPSRYVGLLCFIPLFLGIRAWIGYRREGHSEEGERETVHIGNISVAMLTVANGADNIGLYIPVFSTYSSSDYLITILVFIVMTALLCYLGLVMAERPFIKRCIHDSVILLFP